MGNGEHRHISFFIVLPVSIGEAPDMYRNPEHEIVFPGDVIAKEEEYLSGRNTQDIDGNIIATAFGKVSRDDKSLVISVDTQKQAVVIRRYDIVYGKIIRQERIFIKVPRLYAHHTDN